jgi:hypothetical protein
MKARTEPIGSPCTPDCHRPTGSAAHCTVCHQTFGTVGNFDRHRKGGWCLAPETLGMEQLRGPVWRVPMTESQRLRLQRLTVDRPERPAGTTTRPETEMTA